MWLMTMRQSYILGVISCNGHWLVYYCLELFGAFKCVLKVWSWNHWPFHGSKVLWSDGLNPPFSLTLSVPPSWWRVCALHCFSGSLAFPESFMVFWPTGVPHALLSPDTPALAFPGQFWVGHLRVVPLGTCSAGGEGTHSNLTRLGRVLDSCLNLPAPPRICIYWVINIERCRLTSLNWPFL